MKSMLFLSFFNCLLSCGSTADQHSPADTVDKVVVYKARKEMQLLKRGKVIRTYVISLGDNSIRHKQQEGDERTPEGKYVLDWRNSQSAYHKSIHISYPNKEDKASARKRGVSPGGDIMIHGMAKNMAWLGASHMRDSTNGCIAITNEEMDEVWARGKKWYAHSAFSIDLKRTQASQLL